ncbi:carbohydrate ABC transporter permease [Paenibacillus thalictri]|uniref:Carbohydrate ABC transporter permease n=1 Tax=Paenibacillus thalictri TaxID=2527873 RepID=A0A4Q9E0T4_9BACL|nr:carbohydrate ABC transporter permease [Paenibacillus thalictri]TBL81161.1 carbohydrate ABC transporter permease [Paenibacillus thalictri]
MVIGTKDKWFDASLIALLSLSCIVVIFPLLFVISASITPYAEVMRNGGFVVIPRSVTFTAYVELFKNAEISHSLLVTLFITVVGTILNLVLTSLLAYPLSRRNLPYRKIFLFLILFTMLFNGGIIPTYLIVKATGLMNTVWAMMIPNAIGAFHVLVIKSFFESLPEELFESAKIDGAKEVRLLLQIVIPLSIPVLLTVGLFYAVSHWNELFQAIMYITNRELLPIQVIIREIIMLNDSVSDVAVSVPTLSLQMAAVVIASAPIIAVYPFIQRHFVKGMMIGSIKG